MNMKVTAGSIATLTALLIFSLGESLATLRPSVALVIVLASLMLGEHIVLRNENKTKKIPIYPILEDRPIPPEPVDYPNLPVPDHPPPIESEDPQDVAATDSRKPGAVGSDDIDKEEALVYEAALLRWTQVASERPGRTPGCELEIEVDEEDAQDHRCDSHGCLLCTAGFPTPAHLVDHLDASPPMDQAEPTATSTPASDRYVHASAFLKRDEESDRPPAAASTRTSSLVPSPTTTLKDLSQDSLETSRTTKSSSFVKAIKVGLAQLSSFLPAAKAQTASPTGSSPPPPKAQVPTLLDRCSTRTGGSDIARKMYEFRVRRLKKGGLVRKVIRIYRVLGYEKRAKATMEKARGARREERRLAMVRRIDGLYGGERVTLGRPGLRYHPGFAAIYRAREAEPLPHHILDWLSEVDAMTQARGASQVPEERREAGRGSPPSTSQAIMEGAKKALRGSTLKVVPGRKKLRGVLRLQPRQRVRAEEEEWVDEDEEETGEGGWTTEGVLGYLVDGIEGMIREEEEDCLEEEG